MSAFDAKKPKLLEKRTLVKLLIKNISSFVSQCNALRSNETLANSCLSGLRLKREMYANKRVQATRLAKRGIAHVIARAQSPVPAADGVHACQANGWMPVSGFGIIGTRCADGCLCPRQCALWL